MMSNSGELNKISSMKSVECSVVLILCDMIQRIVGGHEIQTERVELEPIKIPHIPHPTLLIQWTTRLRNLQSDKQIKLKLV